ncbi:MAG: excinuclease ABC subunit UvrA [Leptospiraceae bacterium]|nr:excinuclease ABC subunit UvrA [Leptospiraceae bacterium]
MQSTIRIVGAREHNLKNINLEIPKNQLVVITGISGSGKSSLAFDTIYAEGQRRYVESLSAYARQFLGQLEKPNVDSIEGLSPAISIEQKTTHRNPRSTVGTVTEIYDYLRLIFARIGIPHCYSCGKRLEAQSVDTIVDRLFSLRERLGLEELRLQILSPVVRSKKGEFRELFESLLREGFVRVRVDGEIRQLEEEIRLKKNVKHDIELVVDRLILRASQAEEIRSRLSESVELALKKGDGQLLVHYETEDRGKKKVHEESYSSKLYCPKCDLDFPEITPRFFSFNSPEGACSHCSGLGAMLEFHPDLLIPDKKKTIREGIVAALGWSGDSHWYQATMKALSEKLGFSLDTPWEKIPEKIKQVILYGDKNLRLQYTWSNEDEIMRFTREYEGIITNLHRRYLETNSEAVRQRMELYMMEMTCPVCSGARLRREALSVLLHGKNIRDITRMTLTQAYEFFSNLKLSEREEQIAKQAMREILNRLTFLNNVGVGYLTLDRSAGTLSGGEAQRIRLATQIGSALTGVLYVLDEPSIGLHQSDNERLIKTLKGLRDLGNSVVVVEHDEETILAADYVVDMGPGAGRNGGYVVAAGTPQEIMQNPKSLTGDYLARRKRIPLPKQRRKGNNLFLTIHGARENNLKNIKVSFPLGMFVCVTGLSGSGKSSLVHEILYKALARKLHHSHLMAGKHDKITGAENIDKVIHIDQSPIGRTPRSNPATYTSCFTPIRELFASLPASKMRGYNPGRFSFNVPGGRCEACEGDGVKKIEMHFLSDVYITCEVCRGKRYNRETLEVRYKGANIYDVLEMSVDEALEFFDAIPAVRTKLKALQEVGLGYIKLGQSATTLSGGEAQRVKLASELARKSTGKTLYILDEPTTGLHFEDIRLLLHVLHRFVDEGNTVIVIEHNMDVIKTADYIIDLGPGGGDAGGRVVFAGPPEKIVHCTESLTGQYLKKWLQG